MHKWLLHNCVRKISKKSKVITIINRVLLIFDENIY